MSQADKLPKNQPAEIHVDGVPQYAGEISATLEQGLLLSDARLLRGKQLGKTLHVHAGSKADLVFQELFDEEGVQIVVPVTIAGSEGNDISLEFRDQVAEVTATALRLLKSKKAGTTGPKGTDTEALPELRKRALRQLDKIISNFIMSLADHLFDLSSRPQSAANQEELYEAMNTLKRGKDSIRDSFAEQINAFFDDPIKPEHEDSGEGKSVEYSELNLVDIQDFEDSLSLNRMVKMGQDKYSAALESLIIRFAEVADTDPLTTRLPFHVAQICEAFRGSIHNRNIPNVVAPEVYSFFSDQVVRKLDPFFTSLNAFLRERGISPEVEGDIKKYGSVLKKLDSDRRRQESPKPKPQPAPEDEEKPKPPPGGDLPSEEESLDLLDEARRAGVDQSAEKATPEPEPAPEQDAEATKKKITERVADELVETIKKQFNPDDLYRSVIDALNFRRDNIGGEPLPPGGVSAAAGEQAAAARSFGGDPAAPVAGGTGAPAVGTPPSTNALASALSALQGDSNVRTQLHEQPSIRQYLSDNQGSIAELEGTQGIAPDNLNQLDLVDNLFSDISTDVDVTPDLKPAVGDLQIPLAKLALLEPQFFADREHPARGVIDKVAQLSSSGNYPNKALENRVTGIIDNIVDNYKTESDVFENALGELDSLSGQQQRALERNVERVVKTQDGQQKLQKAEKAVEKVLRSRIRPPSAPKPIVDLVDKGWRDLLKLTYVKSGPNSKAWKDYVKTLDLLSLWLIEQQKGGDDAVQVERALEAEPFIDMVRQQISEALPTHMEHEPVLDNLKEVLSGRSDLEQVPVEPPEEDTTPKPGEIRKKVESLPRLRRWVKRVDELETGNWLTYRDDEGAKKRMQLAWVSEERDRYIFVNERGQKVADISGIELARQLSRGVKPPTPTEELPLVDQTMYKTLEHVQKSLSFDKNHDTLTKLINRETFLNQVELALQHAKSKHAIHSLLYIDIDQFAIVNDVYDELTGDQVLAEFARLLAQQHGRKISSARIEGNQFAVLLLDRSLEQAIAHAEGIRTDIEKSPVTIENDKVSFTVSIGVCTIVDHSESVEEILENAVTAVRQAKEEGRNRVVQFHQDQKRVAAYRDEEAAAIAQIEETLDTKNFVLQAQPIAYTNPREGQDPVEHYEVLLSIANEKGELHSPQDFIISAERFGYMSQVDRWVVRQVFSWISLMMDEQKVVPNLSINLSGNSITDDSFMDYLFEQISEHGVGTDKICFEITETGTINNMVKATDFVNSFKNIGCKFSIDDFGTGLASHSYLRELPVDYVKIDGTFVSSIHENPKDYAMTKSINDLAHFLGQETIAEFAESDVIIEKLREIGVDYIQGWGVGKPSPLTDLSKDLAQIEK